MKPREVLVNGRPRRYSADELNRVFRRHVEAGWQVEEHGKLKGQWMRAVLRTDKRVKVILIRRLRR